MQRVPFHVSFNYAACKRYLFAHHKNECFSLAPGTSGSSSNTTYIFAWVAREVKQHQESIKPQQIENKLQQPEKNRRGENRGRRRRKEKSTSKSLSDLEFEEVKGFMDLGFVFSEEDKDSSLVEIIPGLQKLGKKNDEEEGKNVDESSVSRPYLSEAWEVLERKNNPLQNWRVPAPDNDIDMKDSLKWWAHTVASAVR